MARIYNHLPDVVDERDKLFTPTLDAAKLPSKVNLQDKFPPVFDQGSLGSCTANGIVALREYYQIASGLPLTDLSRLYLYYKEREIEGTVDQDSGAYIRDGMKVLNKLGCAPEADLPYDVGTFTQKPSDKAESDAGQFKIAAYHRVMLNAKYVRAAIARKQPVVFGFKVYSSFESQSVSDTGVVPMPDTQNEEMLGGHCVVAVGYDDDLVFPAYPDVKGYVIGRNSWGEHWGDKGYFYMPYAMFNFPLVTDMWTGQLNPPKTASEVPFLQAIQHYADAGIIDNPPTNWVNFATKLNDGTLTIADCKYVPMLIQKLAARDITLAGL